MTSASFHPQSGPLRPAQKDSVLSFKKTYPGLKSRSRPDKTITRSNGRLTKICWYKRFQNNFTFTTGLPSEDRNYKVGNSTWNMELS